MNGRSLSAVVLAAGSGSRMQSNRPKPLHLLCGRPMLFYVLDSLAYCPIGQTVVVVGSGAERITKRISEELPDRPVDFVEQPRPRGTADAAAAGVSALVEDDLVDGDVLILAGDLPLLSADTVAELVVRHQSTDSACTIVTARLDDPGERSRVVRGRDGRIVRLARGEELDPDELEPVGVAPEVAALAYCVRRGAFRPALRRLSPDPADGEYRLADIVEVLVRAGYTVGSVETGGTEEIAEVDDRVHLAEVEATIRRRINLGWLASGVTMVDPATVYVDATVALARDVTIFPNTLLQGRTAVGEGAEVGPDTRLVDCVVGAGARVEKTVGRDAEIGMEARVGPFAVLEPGAQVAPSSVVPPFTTVDDTAAEAPPEDLSDPPEASSDATPDPPAAVASDN
jgi:bifunctional UDP-N-acetylglucosamine pyrophosphorylase/glucosamine-1-phosphate N-acetyltransferase